MSLFTLISALREAKNTNPGLTNGRTLEEEAASIIDYLRVRTIQLSNEISRQRSARLEAEKARDEAVNLYNESLCSRIYPEVFKDCPGYRE